MSQEKIELEHYQELTPQVEAIAPERLTVFVGDDLPQIGELLWVGSADGPQLGVRCAQSIGQRRVVAHGIGPWPQWLKPGAPVRRSHVQATLDQAQGQFNQDGQPLDWESPGWMALDMSREPLTLGLEILDTLTPLAQGGVHLCVDQGEDAAWFERLGLRVSAALGHYDELITVGSSPRLHALLGGHAQTRHPLPSAGLARIYALRAALSYVAHRPPGTYLVALELPRLGESESLVYQRHGEELGQGQFMDLISGALASTHGRSVTTIMRMPVDPRLQDLSHTLETLSLGDVDAQLLIDKEGAVVMAHSRSKVELEPAASRAKDRVMAALAGAHKLRERAKLFGEDELEEEQRATVELAKAYERCVIS